MRQFDDPDARLGISRVALNQRLTRLVDDGVLGSVPYRDNPPRLRHTLICARREPGPMPPQSW
jgi:DNA-binding HxlR family transcriptional regulator